MVNLGCYECVDQSFTMTERDMFTNLSNVAQVVERRVTYAVYLFVIDMIVLDHASIFFAEFDE